LMAEDQDLALRMGPLADSSQVSRTLGRMRMGYYASPSYLSGRGAPQDPEALADHACLSLAEPGSQEVWFFTGPKRQRTFPVTARWQVPSVRAGQAAARAGLGIARLPTYLVQAEVRRGELVPVLEAHTPAGTPLVAVYPSGRQLPLKVRAFLDL